MSEEENGYGLFAPVWGDFKRIRPWSLTAKQWLKVLGQFVKVPAIYVLIMLPAAFIVRWIFPVHHDAAAMCGIADGIAWPANLIMSVFSRDVEIVSHGAGTAYKVLFRVTAFVVYGGCLLVAFLNTVFWLARYSVQKRPEKGGVVSTFDPTKREIKIFISSTFQDMQEERDMLIIKTFPLLQQEALRRNVRLTPIDLRWGITQQEAESGKVIGKCLDGIHDSSPFFIGLVGDRYGWRPTREDFLSDPTVVERHPWLREKIQEGLSMTQLEFLYGISEGRSMSEGLILIQGGLTAGLALGKSGEFKRWVIDSGHFRYKYFMIADDLATHVEKYVRAILDRHYPMAQLSMHDRMSYMQDVFAYRHTQFYVPRRDVEQALELFMAGDNKVIVVDGEIGSGKTAAVTAFAERLRREGKIGSPYYFYEMHDCTTEEVKVKCEVLRDIGADLVVMDLNNVSVKHLQSLIDTFEKLSPGCRIIFTVDSDTSAQACEARLAHYTVPPADDAFRREFLRQFFAVYAKRLSQAQLDRVASTPYAGTPFVLKTIARELIVFGRHELLDEKIDALTGHNDEDALFDYLVESAAKVFDRDDFRDRKSTRLNSSHRN